MRVGWPTLSVRRARPLCGCLLLPLHTQCLPGARDLLVADGRGRRKGRAGRQAVALVRRHPVPRRAGPPAAAQLGWRKEKGQGDTVQCRQPQCRAKPPPWRSAAVPNHKRLTWCRPAPLLRRTRAPPAWGCCPVERRQPAGTWGESAGGRAGCARGQAGRQAAGVDHFRPVPGAANVWRRRRPQQLALQQRLQPAPSRAGIGDSPGPLIHQLGLRLRTRRGRAPSGRPAGGAQAAPQSLSRGPGTCTALVRRLCAPGPPPLPPKRKLPPAPLARPAGPSFRR